MDINKKDVIQLLENIAVYMEVKGDNPFRTAAYRKAAQGLERDVRSLSEIDDLTQVTGIGKGTKEVISEYVETGQSAVLRELQEEVPEGLIPLLKLPGLGGKRLAILYQELHITDRDTLKKACEDGRLETVKGFGKKTAENIRKAIENEAERPERLPVHYMLQLANDLEMRLKQIPDIQRFNLAGSMRRLEETIKDIDFIVVPKNRSSVRHQLTKLDNVQEIVANGETKVSVTLNDEYQVNVDFRLVEPAEFATTLHHFTGSKDHNVNMRQLAKKHGKKINEYGVMVEETGEIIQFETEKDLFRHFHLHDIPPEMRQANGEVEAFTEEINILNHDQILGDLHMHTTWSDGAESVEEMVLYGRKLGYEFMAITDHSKFLSIANGLSESRLRKQREEILRVNEKYPDIHLLCGVEMDILPNGELDYSDDFLREMDFVIAAIHSSFNQTEDQIMQRLFTALENPHVDLLAHPTGRIIGRRKGYSVNLESLLKKAQETNTALELNANPQRFDLATEWLEKAVEQKVPVAINTDAHNTRSLHFMNYGVRRAKKAWLKKENIINAWHKDELLDYINRNK